MNSTKSNVSKVSDEALLTLYYLTGMDRGGSMRSQASVAEKLGKSSKTISRHCDKLEELGAISSDNRKTHKKYWRGPKFSVFRDSALAIGQGMKRPPDPEWFPHLTGNSPMFKVEAVGNLETVKTVDGIEVPLFQNARKYQTSGSENQETFFIFGKDTNARFSLRLQTSRNGSILYVNPSADILVPMNDACDDKKCLDAVVDACTPILDLLESNDWTFSKRELGGYALHNQKAILKKCQNQSVCIYRAPHCPDTEAFLDRLWNPLISSGISWNSGLKDSEESDTNNPEHLAALSSISEIADYIVEAREHHENQMKMIDDLSAKLDTVCKQVERISEMFNKTGTIGFVVFTAHGDMPDNKER